MAHRASMIGGEFKIESLPGRGARVTCQLPAGGIATLEEHE
jgi:signal transduction histidine kinase